MFTHPQRLFLHNLFVCTNIDVRDIEIKINDTTYEKFQAKIKILLDNEKKENRSEESVLPLSFIKFVKSSNDEVKKRKQLSPKDKNAKGKDYYLHECYKSILEVVKRLSQNDRLDKMNTEDHERIKKFETNVKYFFEETDLAVISYKTLERIFCVNGREYNSKQEEIILYLLEYIFPEITDTDEVRFLSHINEWTWDELIFRDIKSSSYQKPTNVDSLQCIKGLLQKLKKCGDSDYKQIGELLVQIYKELCRLHKTEVVIISSGKISIKTTEESHTVSPSLLPESTDSDALISSHIVAFLKWLPIVDKENVPPNIMSAVFEVTEEIQEEMCIRIGDQIKSSSFRKSKDNFFIREENDELRKLLISTMHKNPCLHTQFHDYIGVSNSNMKR